VQIIFYQGGDASCDGEGAVTACCGRKRKQLEEGEGAEHMWRVFDFFQEYIVVFEKLKGEAPDADGGVGADLRPKSRRNTEATFANSYAFAGRVHIDDLQVIDGLFNFHGFISLNDAG